MLIFTKSHLLFGDSKVDPHKGTHSKEGLVLGIFRSERMRVRYRSRQDDRLGVIGKVLAFVRNGRYPERTFLHW
ncbi:hypothetical protein TNCV_4550271 [Trichonephila clavipes]|nr:hypothetical protein TNCV_4550271 [Trichonephila clavipes]